MAQLDLRPAPVSIAPARRLPQLAVGLVLYGVSMAMQIRAVLGLSPWDVLHEGLTKRLDISFGLTTALTAGIVLLLWIPLRQRPGIGTLANVVFIAVTVDLTLALLQTPDSLIARIALLVGGVALNGLATATYVGVRLGPGPRDGLMTGLAARTGRSVRVVRTGIEIVVLGCGWLLGGTVGAGTVLYALGIGPATQFFLRYTYWHRRDPA
ncbi:YczE/YyaS/YitT family protein [Tamaricihabitans halophyticus]|nr:hypothetical protein [Tamaricihabitans halophyticus]